MQKESIFRKIIHFPGGYGQVRQIMYCLVRDRSASLATGWDTQIVFIEIESDPFKYDPDWGFVNSNSGGSNFIPDYLLNKVLTQELQGCDLGSIKAAFVSCPDADGVRHVNEWVFVVDMNYSIRAGKYKNIILDFNNEGELLLFSLGFHGFEQKPVRLGMSVGRAGIYPVRINTEKPKIKGANKKDLLDALGLKSNDVQQVTISQ